VVIVLAVIIASGMYAVASALSESRPRPRTSARDRLLRNNPGLRRRPDVRWSVAARRVRTRWTTAFAVTVALLVVTDRPRVVGIDDRDGR
jgi:hypothetical protein